MERGKDLDQGNRHYSEKGGHKARGDYKKDILQSIKNPVHLLPVDIAWLARRTMLRVRRDGR